MQTPNSTKLCELCGKQEARHRISIQIGGNFCLKDVCDTCNAEHKKHLASLRENFRLQTEGYYRTPGQAMQAVAEECKKGGNMRHFILKTSWFLMSLSRGILLASIVAFIVSCFVDAYIALGLGIFAFFCLVWNLGRYHKDDVYWGWYLPIIGAILCALTIYCGT